MSTTIAARWQDWSGKSIEHLVLHETAQGVITESVIVGHADDRPFALHYRVSCDGGWRLRRAEVALVGQSRSLELLGDGTGNWTDGSGASLAHLKGAIDIDLTASPFTNTLPIRRLKLARGESHDIVTAYIVVPDLTVTTDPQRYTCLEPDRLYRFESLDSDFTRDIEVDATGLVVTYPGLFRRLL
jgi:hypothetical protein